MEKNTPLIDGFGRHITYLRLSVTDRCNLRCDYCMPERMHFLPKADLLSFAELSLLCEAFIARGVKHIRVTGGEPLVRRDIMQLLAQLGRNPDLQELTLTTNATHLADFAKELKRIGIRRINVSLDTLEREKFHQLTRRDQLDNVLAGIDAARAAGLKVKINTVALKSRNIDELPQMIGWAHEHGMDLTIIETMPMGEIEGDRFDDYIALTDVKQILAQDFEMHPSDHKTSGPAHYFELPQTGGRLGFIAPQSHNFCEACNRVRVTCTGTLYTCLGQDGKIDLRAAIRSSQPQAQLDKALTRAMIIKPRGHDFNIHRARQTPAIARHMSVTGG